MWLIPGGMISECYDLAVEGYREAIRQADDFLDEAFHALFYKRSEADNADEIEEQMRALLDLSHTSTRRKFLDIIDISERPIALAEFDDAVERAFLRQCSTLDIAMPESGLIHRDYSYSDDGMSVIMTAPMPIDDAMRIVESMDPARGEEMRRWAEREYGMDRANIDFPMTFAMRAKKDGGNTRISFSTTIDGRSLVPVHEQEEQGWPCDRLHEHGLKVAAMANVNLGRKGQESIINAGIENRHMWFLKRILFNISKTSVFTAGIQGGALMLTGAIASSSIPMFALIGGMTLTGVKMFKFLKKAWEKAKERIEDELGLGNARNEKAENAISDIRKMWDSIKITSRMFVETVKQERMVNRLCDEANGIEIPENRGHRRRFAM